MEGVDHVHVVQVGGSGLVGEVDWVLEGQVPDGEGLELGVTGLDAPLVLVVELGQAGGHLAAAGAGGGDHHQGAAGLDILVLPKPLVRDDMGNVVGIARDGVVAVHPDPQLLQPGLESVGGGLPGILGDYHTAHIQLHGAERVDEAEDVAVVCDAQVPPHLVLLNVGGIDGDDDLRAVLHLCQHPDLAVRLKPGQHPAGVEIIKQLASKFQVQLAPELGDTLPNVLGLELQILVVIEPLSGHALTPYLIVADPVQIHSFYFTQPTGHRQGF